jgi:hypothetical protein
MNKEENTNKYFVSEQEDVFFWKVLTKRKNYGIISI